MREGSPPLAGPLEESTPARSSSPTVDSEITWLLHRAAQRMRQAIGEQAQRHGLQLRDHIVLSALEMDPTRTQGQLAKALGLDKTTLMSQLDRLERMGLAQRISDPHDRRARIPVLTEAGRTLRQDVADAGATVETASLGGFTGDQVRTLRTMLIDIIGDSEDPGSCL